MNAKPILQVVKLPWQVSYSATGLLVKVSEDKSNLEIGLNAGLLSNTITDECFLPNTARKENFDEISDKLRVLGNFYAIMRSVVPYWLQVLPLYSDTLGLDPNEFDWSLIDNNFLPHRRYATEDEWIKSSNRFDSIWYSTGYCPLPQIYYLKNSNWLNSIAGIPDNFRQTLTHYIITAHDHRVDIITTKLDYTLKSTSEDINIEFSGEITPAN